RPAVAGPPLDEDSCKLSVLERHLAGYHRVGDVPGFEIPSRYFRFVRDGNAHPLEAVLEHNRIDLISLAVVTARALRLIEHGPASASHPRECLGLGRLYERAGGADDAEACYAEAALLAARVGHEPDVHAEALRRLAILRRRAGRTAAAAAAWQELVSVPGCPSMLRREAREALAIHHEHRSRDLKTARTFVLDVLAEQAGPRWREQAEYRLRRLERKMAVRERGGLMAALEDSLIAPD
ncbi:MAG: ribonuclease H-like domain-containing protein, partial [Vicinamibacterales bacterium]